MLVDTRTIPVEWLRPHPLLRRIHDRYLGRKDRSDYQPNAPTLPLPPRLLQDPDVQVEGRPGTEEYRRYASPHDGGDSSAVVNILT